MALWRQDEAGPYQALPQPGETWHPAGHPTTQPHEYVRGGTAKFLTLFHPATGRVRAQGVLSAPNAVLHPWLKDQLSQVLAQLEAQPLPIGVPLPEDHRLVQTWQHWWWPYERPKPAPALRLIVAWDNLAGHLVWALIWDNASWHVSKRVRARIRTHNRLVKQTREGVRILPRFLPVKSPWLNPIEPKWVQGKRAIVDPTRLLSAREVADRACAYVGCSHEPHLTIPDKVA